MIPDRVLDAPTSTRVARRPSWDAGEVMVSWLPLYHDMGLVGFLAIPMTTGVRPRAGRAAGLHGQAAATGCSGSPTTGARRPPGPNFAWVLATRALTARMRGPRPVDARAGAQRRRAGRSDGGRGIRRRGRAVRVAARRRVPGVRDGRGRDRRRVPAPRHAGWSATPSTASVLERIASPSRSRSAIPTSSRSGPPAPAARHRGAGHGDAGRRSRTREPRARAARRRAADPRHVGDARATTSDPDATAALFHDGWLCTGDLAYLLDGELVLCGRIKDVIIVGGRNVFPEDIERAVGGLDGVRAGNVIAFGMEGYKGKESGRRRGRGAHRRPRRPCGRRSTTARSRCAGYRPRRDARAAGHLAQDVVAASCSAPSAASVPRRRARTRRLTEAIATRWRSPSTRRGGPPATRDGSPPARAPSTAITPITTSGTIGIDERAELEPAADDAHRPAEERPHQQAHERPGHCDQHRLPPHDDAGLVTSRADRAQQAELVCALVDREHQAVGDVDEGDDHGQREQART